MILILLAIVAATGVTGLDTGPSKPREGHHHEFSPRMDYDEWTPLGRGDPLNNDPTYDYMPPVLDRVHYWVDPKKRTPDPHIMVTSVMTEPPTNLTPATSRLGTLTLLDPFFKFMDRTKSVLGVGHSSSSFRPTPTTIYHSPHHHTPPIQGSSQTQSVDYMPPPPVQNPKVQALQRPPYTILMPPPPPISAASTTEGPATSFGTSTRTTSKENEPIITSTSEGTILTTGQDTSTPTPPPKTSTTSLANADNLYRPVAITMPESISNETMEVPSTTIQPMTPIDQSMTLPIHALFSENTNHLQDDETDQPSDMMEPPPADEYYGFLPTTIRTTTTQVLTTDPIFKHYKQPSKPARGGPFYLIIQGHSKVKTYGASKNKLTPLSVNEINFEDGQMSHYDEYENKNRHSRKLTFRDISEEVIDGRPVVELGTSFQAKRLASFSVAHSEMSKLPESLESVVPNKTHVAPAFSSRRLLASVTTATAAKPDEEEEEQLGLESLIALNEDYNSEDVINLLLKQEGQGSGYSGFVSSLFGRSLSSNDEI